MRAAARVAAIVLATLTGVVLLWKFQTGVEFFLLSLLLAAAARPAIDYLVRRGAPLGLAMIATYLTTFLVLGAILYVASNYWILELQRASDSFTDVYDRIKLAWPAGNFAQRFVAQRLPPPQALYQAVSGPEGLGLLQTGLGFTLGVFDNASKFMLIVVLSLYWSADRVHFERIWLSLLPAESRARARTMWRRIEGAVGAYVRSELVQSLLAGVLLVLGYRLIGIEYAALLSLAGAVLWLVPLMGGAMAVVLAVLVGLIHGPLAAAAAGIYTLLVFGLLELVVEPRVLRQRTPDSILTILSMIALADALGVVGLLLAPPVAGAIQILYGELVTPPALVPEQTKPEPQLAQLHQRLEDLKAAIAEEPETVPPEIDNLVQRLDELLGQAGDVVEESGTPGPMGGSPVRRGPGSPAPVARGS